ncbi:MAG: hypothetical protein O6940_06690 [Ignavibacteria bacterium]|nr:hypothetical protein [Ignavibacteria bacterium]
MLLNNYYKFIGITIILLSIIGCGKKNDEHVNFDDPRSVRNIANNVIDETIRFSASGYFSSDTNKSIIAGTEKFKKSKMGISFSLLEKVDDEFKVVYNTGVLEGSFNKCIVDKMKFSSNGIEMIYYNSKDYYLGTSGGDVYLYVIDFIEKEVYYGHLIAERSSGTSLFLSENLIDPMLRRFFISYFKKDYTALRIINSDKL